MKNILAMTISTLTFVLVLCLGIISESQAATTCEVGSDVRVDVEGGQKRTRCANSTTKWEYFYNEHGSEILSQQFHFSDGEWVLKEVYKPKYNDNNIRTTNDQFVCNGYSSNGVSGPSGGCILAYFHTYNSSGRLQSSLNCTTSSNYNNINCVNARNNFCTPACSSCSNGECLACTGDYMLQDNTCVKTCSNGYLSASGACIAAGDCKNGFHADNGACVANSDANCNTEIGGKCVECKNETLEQNGSCVNSCGTNYKDMGGFCNRVRYTPAEAAEIAKDDGNVVTITFKK